MSLRNGGVTTVLSSLTSHQVKIHCLTPRLKLRDGESKETSSQKGEDLNADLHIADVKSNGSVGTFAGSDGSCSSKDLNSPSHQGEPGVKDANFSIADSSHRSYDSEEGSVRKESFSQANNLRADDHSLIGRKNLTGSHDSIPQGSYHNDEPSLSNHSSFNSQLSGPENHFQDGLQEFTASSLRISDSSKSLLEAAENTIEDLHAEAKMWERNARKLMIDLDILRKEHSDQSKKQANLDMELSASFAERDGLRKEVEQLKLMLEKMAKSTILEDSANPDEGVRRIQKELEKEIKFQKESNANLTLQLKRSQESNIELVSVLQELEETIEKQKIEVENLAALQSKFGDMENSLQVNTMENKSIMLELQRLQESEKNLQAKVQLLQHALEDNNQKKEHEESLSGRTLLDIETEYKSKLSDKEVEIASLKVKLSESLTERYSTKMESINGGDVVLIGEIEALRAKLEELERDCNELTYENLELVLKLKRANNNLNGGDATSDFSSSEILAKSFASCRSEVNDHESQIANPEEKLKHDILREIEDDYHFRIQELESWKMEVEVKVTELGKEVNDKRHEIEKLRASLVSKEEEILELRGNQNQLESTVSGLQQVKVQLEKKIEVVQRESDIATKCLNDMQNDLKLLSSSVDSHVSANKALEMKSSELENRNHELELHLSELKQENSQLSVSISGLEAQLRNVTDEKKLSQLELENSKSRAIILQDEVTSMRNDTDTHKVDLKQKLEDMHNQWLEAKEECEYVKTENLNLQASAENLFEECSSFQISNGDLERQNLQLHEHCTHLETKLNESHKSFTDCIKRVSVLEEKLSLILEDTTSKEKSLTLELDALLNESRRLNDKLVLEEALYFEKTVEIKSLQQEVEHLTGQLSATEDEKERIASDALDEISRFREGVSKLEAVLNAEQIESETKIRGLMSELAATKQKQDMLKADHDRLFMLSENHRSGEEKLKTALNALELKLTVSECERQQLTEETTNLKVQLFKIGHLQDEVLALKNELSATKSEKEKLEVSLHLVAGECEEWKVERNSFVEKISSMQKSVSELEDHKQNRIALEEKLRGMKRDLIEKEAPCAQDVELRKEISQIRKANRQLQRKIQLLEEDKDECLNRAQALEEELELMKKEQQNQKEPSSLNSYPDQHQRKAENGYEIYNETPPNGVDPVSQIRLLEDELSKAVEANNMYKVQVKR